MSLYLQFKLDDGTNVFIEASEPQKSSGGLIPSSRSEHASDQPILSFENSFSAVQKMAAVMLKNLHGGFITEPDEVSISFGVKASSEISNLIISRGGGDNNFNITLRWRKEKKED